MKKIEPYTVVTRDAQGVEVAAVGLRAPNADIAVRRAKQARDAREHRGVRAYSTVAVYPGEPAPLIRSALVATLIAHQRLDIGNCGCGWNELGASFAEHVADAYERVARASTP